MKLFSGLERSDYQDVLRAVGAMVDDQAYREIRLWEHEDGLIVQGRPEIDGSLGRYQTYLASDDDLQGLLDKAYSRRGMLGRRIEMVP